MKNVKKIAIVLSLVVSASLHAGNVESGYLKSSATKQEVESNINIVKETKVSLKKLEKEISEKTAFIDTADVQVSDFTNTILKYQTYVDKYIKEQASCLVLEDRYELSPSLNKRTIERRAKAIERCYVRANKSLEAYSVAQTMVKKLYQELLAIEEEANDLGIELQSLFSAKVLLKAQLDFFKGGK